MPGRTYSEEEVREILRRAVEKSAMAGPGLTREDLLTTARDAGIDPAAVEDAITTLEWDREVSEEVLLSRRAERRKLASSFLTWAIITVGLFAIHWFSGGSLWFVWLVGVWAVVLLLRLKGAFFANPESERRRAERNVEQRRRQRDARRQRQARAVGREGDGARRSEPVTQHTSERARAAAHMRAPEMDELDGTAHDTAGSTDGAARDARRGRGEA